jgi:chemotaxis protein CheD
MAIFGLGSCVAVFTWEPGMKIGALAHVLLPAPLPDQPRGPAGKYADTAIAAILGGTLEIGGRRERMVAKVVGGAHMFGPSPTPDRETLGERNLRAVLEGLRREGIELAGMDIGGSYGRTLVADTSSGIVRITSLKREPKEI